jgi:hypothetical protein
MYLRKKKTADEKPCRKQQGRNSKYRVEDMAIEVEACYRASEFGYTGRRNPREMQ